MASRNASPKLTARFSSDTDFGLTPYSALCNQPRVGNSRTWSYASGEPEKLDVIDDIDDRQIFIDEYNRLAEKLGIRCMIPEIGAKGIAHQQDASPRRPSWFTRKFKRQALAQSPNTAADMTTRQKRSIGDVAMQMVHSNKEGFKNEDLQGLIQLCGKSFLYLPSEYAPCPLILPTSLRATAHYLIQHAITTPGTFRIPGSTRAVNDIYDYYCTERHGDEITGTVRNPSLPSHLRTSVHDVASAFKKFLSGLPGGILGSLSLFDAFVAIESQLHGDADFERIERDVLRARLIALAVGTVKSQFRRELICAVFGLLCLLGQQAQAKSGEEGQIASEMMGYNAFGIVFGPLLAGELLDSYTLKLADSSSGLILSPSTPPAVRKHRKKSSGGVETLSCVLTVNKIRVANDVTEMLITHWLEVVKNMKSLNILRSDSWAPKSTQEKADSILKASDSDPFVRRKPLKSYHEANHRTAQSILSVSTKPVMSTNRNEPNAGRDVITGPASRLPMRRTRPRSYSSSPAQIPGPNPSVFLLSPMVKEPPCSTPLCLDQHDIGVPSGFTHISKQARPTTNLNSSLNEIPRCLGEVTGKWLATSPSKSGTEGRYSLQFTPKSLIVTQAGLDGQGENIDLRLAGEPNVSGINPLTTKPLHYEEQSMGWLGEYLNLEELRRTPTKTGYQHHDDISSNSKRSFVTPSKGEPHGGNLSEVRAPRSKDQFGPNESNDGLKTIPGFQSHVPTTKIAGVQDTLDTSKQKLGRVRSKTVSIIPVTPVHLQSSGNTDRKHARRSIGGAVRAMAAMFDNAAKDSSFIPTPADKARVRRSSKIFNGLSMYTVNQSPTKSNCSDMSDLNLSTPNKQNHLSQGPQHGTLGGRKQQETPTRHPLRALVGENTDTLVMTQTPSKASPGIPSESLAKLQAKPPRSLGQAQMHNVEHSTTQPPVSAIPRLVPKESETADMRLQAIPYGFSTFAKSQLEDTQRKLYAKKQECDELKHAIVARDDSLALLREELTQTKTESSIWQRRAETAEKRVGAFVSRAAKIKEISRSSADRDAHFRAGLSLRSSPHRNERSSSSAYSRDGDGARVNRTSCTSSTAVDTAGMDGVQQDTSSEWSGGTVVRTTPDQPQTLWMAVDDLLQLATGTTSGVEYLYGDWQQDV